jgi:hypothetical protein
MPEKAKTIRTPEEIEEAAQATRNNMLKLPTTYKKALTRNAIIRYCDEVLSLIALIKKKDNP